MHAWVKQSRTLVVACGLMLGLLGLWGSENRLGPSPAQAAVKKPLTKKAIPPGAMMTTARRHRHHPHMHRALREMRRAKRELTHAAHDFGGHRVAAIAALDTAIGQVRIALKYAHKTPTKAKK